MLGFRGTVTNKVDAKGRVSVPAKFRALLEAEELTTIVCYPALRGGVLEAGGRRLLEEIESMLARLEPFSEQWEFLSHALVGASEELALDSEGRIILPESLRAVAGIKDKVSFVGLGSRFQLWEPRAWEHEYLQAKDRARDLRTRFRAPPMFAPAYDLRGGKEGES